MIYICVTPEVSAVAGGRIRSEWAIGDSLANNPVGEVTLY